MNEQFKRISIKMLWVAIILFCLRYFISGEDIINNFSVYAIFSYAGEAIGVTSIIIVCYENWLWKYDIFENVPVLKKHYSGKIRSTFDGVDREATLDIKQTFLSIKIILKSGESKSNSISASIDKINGEKQLTYCYLNMPQAVFRDGSEMHYGTAMLCVENPQLLEGHYFSDRKTTGDMFFS